MENVMLDKLVVDKNRVDYYFTPSKGLEKYFRYNHLFVEYDVDISDIPKSILVVPFVANIMPLIWLTDSILWLRDIDRTFYDAIPRIKYAYQEMYPNYKFKGTIVPAKTTENSYVAEREAIQLFSGGIDANTTFIRIKEKNPILVNIQGLYNTEITEDKVYNSDKQNITSFAEKYSLQSNFVRSNFIKFLDSGMIDRKYSKRLGDSWWHGLQHSMAFISITIPLAVKFKAKNIYIASSLHLGYRLSCASDPTTDIQFRYATIGGTVHDGFELTRQNKVKLILDFQKQNDVDYPVRVCSFNDKNCCICTKCFRTIVAIIAEGGDLSRLSFNIEGGLDEYVERFKKENIRYIPVESEYEEFWKETQQRMIENEDKINEKGFVSWFLNYDFIKEHKRALFRYRATNFLPILKRKILNLFL